jgi:outer membrane murein-binding lipoprotein Lpp
MYTSARTLSGGGFYRRNAMQSSKVLSVRMPKVEIDELTQRARDAGLPIGTYARSVLHRERVDSAAAIAILHRLAQAQHEEVEAKIGKVQGQVETLNARFEKLLNLLKQMMETQGAK